MEKVNDKTYAFYVSGAVSFLACEWIRGACLFMRNVRFFKAANGATALLLLVLSQRSQAAVTISVPTSLQADLISQTTAQWNATVTPGLFSGDYKIAVTSKKDVVIPVPSTAIPNTASFFDGLLVHGVGDGMDIERKDNVQSIYGLQGYEALRGTCGGTPVSQLTSSTTVLGACVQAYNVMASTINVRWGYIFNSTGGIVSK